MQDESTNKNPEDIIKILVASDIHLGYAEKDDIREHDSFIAFEEVLVNAVKHDVDFILLGGDLFHESKPSIYCVNKCIQLIKRYCFGDKVIGMEFLSKGFEYLRNAGNVNYEDPNLNVSFPIFSIHGNHDDPVGKKQVSAMDLLSSTGLINYFGQWGNLSEIEIVPLIIRKGDTYIALYGLSHIHDQRLARLFHENKVHFKRPPGDVFLHLLVLHQNRANRGTKNFIPIECLPTYIDLVIWGHEHDCLIEPMMENNIYVCQPGSTVATSLAAGEALDKHCGLLLVHKGEFIMRAQPLRTVRPFIFDTYDLSTDDDPDPNPVAVSATGNSKLSALVRRMGTLHPGAAESMRLVSVKVDQMIEEAKNKYQGPSEPPPLPLIRLQVRYTHEYQVFNTIQFGQHYTGMVANPEDIVKLKILPKRGARSAMGDINVKIDEEADPVNWTENIESVLNDFFNLEANKQSLQLLPADTLIKALSQFVKNDDNDTFSIAVEYQMQTVIEKLTEKNVRDEDILETLQQMALGNASTEKLEEAWAAGTANKLLTSRIYEEIDGAFDDIDLAAFKNGDSKLDSTADIVIDEDAEGAPMSLATTSRGRARGRASRGSRRPRGTRAAKK